MPPITPINSMAIDLKPLPPGKLPDAPTEEEKLAAVSNKFESLLIAQLLKTMRSAAEVFSDNSERPAGMGMMSEMMDEYLVQHLSSGRGFGIGQMVASQLGRGMGEEGSGLSSANDLGAQFYPLEASAWHRTRPSTEGGVGSMERYEPIINRAASRYDLDPELIRAVILQESGGDTTAVSPKGAKGLMQLMDGTADELGVKNPFDPQENIFGGSKYLKEQLARWGGDLDKALASYNAGPTAVRRYGGVPPFKETKDYIARVTEMMNMRGTE